MIFEQFDTVVVPFPFIDKPETKKRPALVLSNEDFNQHGHTILAMITTKRHPSWPGDSEISEYAAAGLRLLCLVRFKLFTLDNRLILLKIGHLTKTDSLQIKKNFHRYLNI